jgi:ectoine hydroxylase-related dioxygenase (phytanoyl-CoA dioxygenase family)
VESSHAQRMEALDRDGFVAIPGALGPEAVRRLTAVVDRTYDRRAASGRLEGDGSLHLLGFVSRDPAFRQLVDLADPLALVAGVLGWNIYLYHCHLDVHPPCPGREPPPWRWHQDGGRQNVEVESNPRPRLSLKVAHFLTDLSAPGRGNMMVIPGSHLRNTLPRPADPQGPCPPPADAVELLAAPGTAVVFDRRLWHARSDNRSPLTRKALFLAYTYRWVRPRDSYPVTAAWFRRQSALRRQLMGDAAAPEGHWLPRDDDVPLRRWMQGRGL